MFTSIGVIEVAQEEVKRITPTEFVEQFNEHSKIIDVRKIGEYSAEAAEWRYSYPTNRASDIPGATRLIFG